MRTTGWRRIATVTHLVTRAPGLALKEAPEVNSRLRLGRFVERDTLV